MSRQIDRDLENSMVTPESDYRESPEPDYDGPPELTLEEKLVRAQERVHALWEVLGQRNRKIETLEAELKKKEALSKEILAGLDKLSAGLEGLR